MPFGQIIEDSQFEHISPKKCVIHEPLDSSAQEDLVFYGVMHGYGDLLKLMD